METTANFLNTRQEDAVRWCDGHELVLAGAGSGKTRVLTAKIAYLVNERQIAPRGILAVTFTNKAAREMLERVRRIAGDDLRGMRISTFHSWGLRFLQRRRNELARLGYPPSFVIFDRGDCRSLVKKITKEIGIDPEFAPTAENLSRIYASCDPETLDADMPEYARPLYEKYREALRAQGALDFDDLMILPPHILLTNETILAEERDRTEWILVDEYQDVNTPQYTLLKLLAGTSGRVMAVGDPDQSIYGWRGADISLILNFERDFPRSKVFILDQNYRSTGNILSAANSVIQHNHKRREKKLWTDSNDGSPVVLLKTQDGIAESKFIADEIKRLISGVYEKIYNYKDICILYRMNALSRGYEWSLRNHAFNIPYRIVKGTSYYERKEVKDIISMLRLAINPKDETSLERIANIPTRGLGKKSVSDLTRYFRAAEGSAAEIWEEVRRATPLKGRAASGAAKLAFVMAEINEQATMESAINYILYNGGYADYLRDEFPDDFADRLDNVLELLSTMPNESNIADALAEIAIYTDQDANSVEDDRVNLMTLHSAKGLEFPVVFLAGLEEGIFPSAMAIEENNEVEEERRLCYVGITRARERLYLSWAAERRLFGKDLNQNHYGKDERISRFLKDIQEANLTGLQNRYIGGNSDVFRSNNRRNWRW
jgi:DNA helicase-2/ATP-dependent DNA helicase PcrA